jgi:hypothetical protein
MNKGENAGTFEGQLMEALNADMVKSRLVIGFAQIATEGGLGTSSSVSADYRFTVAPGSSGVSVVRSFKKYKAPFSKNMVYQPQVNKQTRAFLTQPIFSPAPFIESVVDSTSVGAKAGEAVLNTLSILGNLAMGGGVSLSKTRVYTISIDPDQYQTSAESYGGAVLSMFNDQLEGAH